MFSGLVGSETFVPFHVIRCLRGLDLRMKIITKHTKSHKKGTNIK